LSGTTGKIPRYNGPRYISNLILTAKTMSVFVKKMLFVRYNIFLGIIDLCDFEEQ